MSHGTGTSVLAKIGLRCQSQRSRCWRVSNGIVAAPWLRWGCFGSLSPPLFYGSAGRPSGTRTRWGLETYWRFHWHTWSVRSLTNGLCDHRSDRSIDDCWNTLKIDADPALQLARRTSFFTKSARSKQVEIANRLGGVAIRPGVWFHPLRTFRRVSGFDPKLTLSSPNDRIVSLVGLASAAVIHLGGALNVVESFRWNHVVPRTNAKDALHRWSTIRLL